MLNARQFLAGDEGAITVDWVSLTASALLLGAAVLYAIYNSGVADVVGNINDTLVDSTSITTGTLGNLEAQNPTGP